MDKMFIISEISPQFGDDIDLAEQFIMQSKFAGANAVKVQLYPKGMFDVAGNSGSRDYLSLSRESFIRLFEFGEKISIPVFASVFDEERLNWCIDIGQIYYKIAARQHTENPELVQKILKLNKTTFVSIPFASETSMELIDNSNCILFYCIPKYPTLLEEVSLPEFQEGIFQGISDHSIGISVALYAAAHGCQYFEKHFTLSLAHQKSTEGAHLGSMTFDDLKLIRQLTNEFNLLAGKGKAVLAKAKH